MFARRHDQGPSEAFAAEEQTRADNLARKLAEITDHPGHPMAGSAHHFRAAYHDAAGNAAAHTSQSEVQ